MLLSVVNLGRQDQGQIKRTKMIQSQLAIRGEDEGKIGLCYTCSQKKRQHYI